jgi:hypothetical protein
MQSTKDDAFKTKAVVVAAPEISGNTQQTHRALMPQATNRQSTKRDMFVLVPWNPEFIRD